MHGFLCVRASMHCRSALETNETIAFISVVPFPFISVCRLFFISTLDLFTLFTQFVVQHGRIKRNEVTTKVNDEVCVCVPSSPSSSSPHEVDFVR